MNTVHCLYPSHLIVLFQFIVYTFCFLHLHDNQLQSVLRLFVKVCKISPEFSLQHQIIEPYRVMLLQIITMHTAIFADRTILLWKLQIWDKIIPVCKYPSSFFLITSLFFCLLIYKSSVILGFFTTIFGIFHVQNSTITSGIFKKFGVQNGVLKGVRVSIFLDFTGFFEGVYISCRGK